MEKSPGTSPMEMIPIMKIFDGDKFLTQKFIHMHNLENLNNKPDSNTEGENRNNTSANNNAFSDANNDPNPLYAPNDSLSSANNNASRETRDEKDEQIKNETDTARIRSERQSVEDGENKRRDE